MFSLRGARGMVVRSLVGVIAVSAVLLATDPKTSMPVALLLFAACACAYRFDFTNLWVVFALPWLMILGYSMVDISDYSRPISLETLLAIVLVLAIGLVVLPTRGISPLHITPPAFYVNNRVFKLLLLGYVFFSIINVALAGYLPLMRAALTGDSGYMDFGVKGVYGFFNAFANAFGLTAFYLWMIHPSRSLYKWSFFLVLGIFLLFLTRQNIMSLLVEAFVVYFMVVKRVSGLRIFFIAVTVLFAFAAIGDFRVGHDIAELARVRDDFLWVPNAFIWLYAYCYFNILNLDNVVGASPGPAFDGSSLATLLPSFLRPRFEDSQDLLEVSSFTVNSFISPLVHDVGVIGVGLVFTLLCLAPHWYLRRRGKQGSPFLGVTGYAVLYFCFLFSFFVNFWFYLPVIFQLVFLPVFERLLFRRAL